MANKIEVINMYPTTIYYPLKRNQFWAPSKCRGNSTGNNGEGKDVRVSQRTETDNKLHKQQRLQCLGGGYVNVFQARCKKTGTILYSGTAE